MYTRTFVKGLLIPSIGVGVVHAKGEQDKEDCDDSKKLIRARDLPLYVEPPKCVTCSNNMGDDDGFLITTIRCARQEFQQIVGQARMIQVEAQNIVEEVIKDTEDVVTYLRQEENLLPRLGAIGLGGFAGYLLACRKGLMKKTLYSAAGASLIAAVAYPNQAKEYTEEVMCEVKKYAVIGYHFLNGADVDWKKLEKIKPPCFSQKDGAQPLQDEKGKPEPDQTGKDGDKLGKDRDKLGKDEDKQEDKLGKDGDKPPLTDKDQEKPPPDPCIDKVKAAEKSGPDEKRSYIERCRERGICGVPKKKPAVDGDKTAAVTQCDPNCTGPKRGGNRCGPRLKRNDSESKSRTTPPEKELEKCQPPEKPAEQGQPQHANRSCPPGCIPAPNGDPCKAGRVAGQIQPKEQTVDPCNQSGRTKDTPQPSGSTVDPCQPSGRDREPSQRSGSTTDPCQPSGRARESPQQSGSTVDPCQPSGRARESPQQSGNTVDPCQPSGRAKESPQQSGSNVDPCQPKGTTRESPQPSGSTSDQTQPSGGKIESPQSSGNITDPFQQSGMNKDSPQPAPTDTYQGTDGPVCRRKRRVIWENKNQPVQKSGAPQRCGQAEDSKPSPITGGVANGSQGPSTGSEQSNMNPCQSGNKPGSDGNRGPTARDPSDPCKSAIKKSSVTITYPNPPGSADSRVIMNPADKKPCGRSSMPPKEVTNGSHQRRPQVLREDCPPNHSTQPRQSARYGSRQRREPQSQVDEP